MSFQKCLGGQKNPEKGGEVDKFLSRGRRLLAGPRPSDSEGTNLPAQNGTFMGPVK